MLLLLTPQSARRLAKNKASEAKPASQLIKKAPHSPVPVPLLPLPLALASLNVAIVADVCSYLPVLTPVAVVQSTEGPALFRPTRHSLHSEPMDRNIGACGCRPAYELDVERRFRLLNPPHDPVEVGN